METHARSAQMTQLILINQWVPSESFPVIRFLFRNILRPVVLRGEDKRKLKNSNLEQGSGIFSFCSEA
jgi:hypothetical protein